MSEILSNYQRSQTLLVSRSAKIADLLKQLEFETTDMVPGRYWLALIESMKTVYRLLQSAYPYVGAENEPLREEIRFALATLEAQLKDRWFTEASNTSAWNKVEDERQKFLDIAYEELMSRWNEELLKTAQKRPRTAKSKAKAKTVRKPKGRR